MTNDLEKIPDRWTDTVILTCHEALDAAGVPSVHEGTRLNLVERVGWLLADYLDLKNKAREAAHNKRGYA